MTVFGDNDPEDAYDGSDPIDERLRVAVRTVYSIIEERRARGGTARVGARIVGAQAIVDRLRDDLDAWIDDVLAGLADRQRRGLPEP